MTAPRKPAAIVFHLPSPERMIRCGHWLDHHAGSSFLKEAFDLLRAGMQAVLDYMEARHPSARGRLLGDLIVQAEPLFNAYFDPTPRTYAGRDGTATPTAGEIGVNIGIPITLACLKPVLRVAGELALDPSHPIPTELLVMVAQIHAAWHHDGFPPAFVVSLAADPAFAATLRFVVAHEASHYLFRADDALGARYLGQAAAVFEQLLDRPGFFTAAQIAHTRGLFRDADLYASWVEELAADTLAYDICRETFEQRGRHDLMGVTTLACMGAAFEHFLELQGVRFRPTHPYAIARLFAFEKHLQNQVGLPTAEFVKTLTWQLPVGYLTAFCRILQNVRGVTFPD